LLADFLIMRTLLTDTRPEAEKVLISLLRKSNTSKKFAQIRSLSQTAMLLSRRAIARANPNLKEKQINLRFISLHYGKDLEQRVEKYIARKS
jgi:hypothetical protein